VHSPAIVSGSAWTAAPLLSLNAASKQQCGNNGGLSATFSHLA
jgi:hypothetical protein